MADARSSTGKPRLTTFRFDDAQRLEETGVMEHGTLPDEINQILAGARHPGAGFEGRVVFTDEDNGTGMSLIHAWLAPGYSLPTHTHNVHCLYYIIRGSALLGRTELGPGDGFLAPRDIPYRYEAGPKGIEILEFRNATRFDIQFLERSPERWKARIDRNNARAEEWLEAAVDSDASRR